MWFRRAPRADRLSLCEWAELLSDGAVGERRRPAQALPLHLEAAAFVVGHAPAVHLHVRLEDVPDLLLGLKLLVWLTCTQTGRLSWQPHPAGCRDSLL